MTWHCHRWGAWVDVDEELQERRCEKCHLRERVRQHVHDWGKWELARFQWTDLAWPQNLTTKKDGQVRSCKTCGKEARRTLPFN